MDLAEHTRLEQAAEKVSRHIKHRVEQRQEANALVAQDKAAEQRRRQQVREQNRQRWLSYHRRLAMVHQEISERHAGAAAALLTTEMPEDAV